MHFLPLLLEDGLGEEERVGEEHDAVDDGDGAHGEAGVAPRAANHVVVVPLREEGTPIKPCTERCKFVRAKLRESFCPAAASHSRPRQAGA